jgi:hypothetical protein
VGLGGDRGHAARLALQPVCVCVCVCVCVSSVQGKSSVPASSAPHPTSLPAPVQNSYGKEMGEGWRQVDGVCLNDIKLKSCHA